MALIDQQRTAATILMKPRGKHIRAIELVCALGAEPWACINWNDAHCAIHARLVTVFHRGTCPGKVSGAWLFKGTRIPVRALFENPEGGSTVEDFIAWFPSVTCVQVNAVLEHAQRSLAEV